MARRSGLLRIPSNVLSLDQVSRRAKRLDGLRRIDPSLVVLFDILHLVRVLPEVEDGINGFVHM